MTDVRQKTTLGNRFRFLVRGLGLVGFLSAVIGLVLTASVYPPFDTWTRASFEPAVKGDAGTFNQVAVIMLVGGLALVVIALAFELLGLLSQVTGRRTAAGSSTAIQTALAVAAFVLVNIVSFSAYRKFDCTRGKLFTLPDTVVAKLKTIDPTKPTTVVVLQKRITAAGMTKSADALDRAAERKISEKVEDLVDQFREFGPQFKVTVLDVEDESFEDKKDALLKAIEKQPGESAEVGKRNAAVLRAAIDAAPEDSVLFYSEGRVQRLAFQEFYQLDRTASTIKVETTVDGKKVERDKFTNLVLLPQGTEVFANRLDRLDAKKPKVGLLVIHPVLTTKEKGGAEYSSAGLRTALEANGFEVTDIILRKWGRGEPTPAVSTFDETKLERAESQYILLNRALDALESNRKQILEVAAQSKTLPLSELDRMSRRNFGRAVVRDEDRAVFEKDLRTVSDSYADGIKEIREKLDKSSKEYADLQKNERAVEGKRQTDIKAKLSAAVADCDLLVIPRLTVMDAGSGVWIPPSVYPFFNLNDDQAAAVRAFVRAGKPVLACFGPTSIGEGMPVQADDVEKLFNRFGITFGNQAILSQAEAQGIAERRGETLSGGDVDVPPVQIDAGNGSTGKPASPVATALETSAHGASGGKLELKKSGFRPVYARGSAAGRMPFAAEFLSLGKDSWAETRLIGDEDYVPVFDPPKLKADDSSKGPLDVERKGPHPVGAVVEGPVPIEWLDARPGGAAAGAAVLAAATPGLPLGIAFAAAVDPAAYTNVIPERERSTIPLVRLAAFGHGGLFTGSTLDPAIERLLVHTANWQLKRDDRLPKPVAETTPWKFPRVNLSSRDATLWWYGAAILPPVFCGVLGVLVLMMRKVR